MAEGSAQAVRAEIDREIAGKTFCDRFARNIDQFAALPALNWKEGDVWKQMSWGDYGERVAEVAMGLRSLGIRRGDVVALQATNRPEHVIADAGTFHAAGVPVSLYNTLAPDQIAYIADDCGAKVAILENRDFMKRWEEIRSNLKGLKHIVLVEDAEDFTHVDGVMSWDDLVQRGREDLAKDRAGFNDVWSELQPEDPATLIYTSGTTGPPKGVILTHRNLLWELGSVDRLDILGMHATGISYLPLAHIAERMFSHYSHIYYAGSVYFCPELTKALEVVTEARPKAFLAVPRVWEKIHAGLNAAIEAEADARKRRIAQRALSVGREAVRRQRRGAPIPLTIRLQRALFDKLVFSKIRDRIGLDRCEVALTGAAPLSEDVLEFFFSIGLPVYETYGMTETTAVTNTNRPGAVKIGTVGQPLPGVEVRLADDGEVLARGTNIMGGYLNRPDATAETVDADGWIHTGDLGKIDADGFLSIIGRKKELIITAGGKNIAPNNIEGLLKEHPLIGQAAVIGDRRPYVTALIVIDYEAAPVWAQQHGIDFTSVEELIAHPDVAAEVERAVTQANEKLARVEQVKKFKILPNEWTAESDELTPSLKLKRRVITEKYADEIEALYA